MNAKPNNNYLFYKQPFVWITLSFIVGIFCASTFTLLQEVIPIQITTFSALAIAYFLTKKKNGVHFLILVCTGFFMLGGIHVSYNSTLNNASDKFHLYQKGDVLAIRVTDTGSSRKEWKKMTGTLLEIVKNDTVIPINEPLLLFLQDKNKIIESGDVILVASDLSLLKNNGNPGEFDAANYWQKKGISRLTFIGKDTYKIIEKAPENWLRNTINRTRNYLSQALKNNIQGVELTIAQALILGDKSLLEQETKNSFSNTGAMHVLAVSGLHVGIIMQLLLFLLSRFSKFISKKYAVLIVVFLLWAYAVITGLSPSVVRAVFMFSILYVAQVSGKQYNSMNVLFFTAFCLLLMQPATLFDIGFQLSFLAMVGIFLFYPTVEKSIYFPNKLLQTIWSGTAIGISAQLMTTPISLYYFHQFPNYFMLTNIGLMATSGVILGLGLFIFSISWWHFLANLTGIVLTFILFATYYFIEWVENLPGGVAQGFELPFELVVSITVLIVCLFTITRYKVVTALLFTLGLVFVSIVVYMRYENLTKEEIVVYNARQVIVTIRKNDQLFCFYDCKKSDFPKVQFALDSYLKLHPGKVHYFPMSQKNWHIQSEKLAIQTTKMASNFVVSLNNKKYLIYRNDYSNPHELLESKQLTVIGMPWIEGKVDHSLNDGAYMAGI